jgi:uncharacterized protein YwbE
LTGKGQIKISSDRQFTRGCTEIILSKQNSKEHGIQEQLKADNVSRLSGGEKGEYLGANGDA